MKHIFSKIKYHRSNLYIIIFCGLIAALPFVSGKLIYGSDFYFNQARIYSTVNALKDGQIIPQVDPTAFGGFGHSWNLFYGPLPTYLASLLRIFTGNWNLAINLLSIILIICSGVSAYFAVFTITKKRRIAILSAILYMLASPLIVTSFRTSNQSRMLVAALMPLVFDGIFRIFTNKKYGVAILSLAASGIILSHMLSIIIAAIPALIFIAINYKKTFSKEIFFKLSKSAFIILGFTAFFTLPFLETQRLGIYNISNTEFKQTAMSMVPKTAYESSISLGNLLFNNQEYPVSGIFIQLWLLLGTSALFLLARRNMPKNIQQINSVLFALLIIFVWLCSDLVPWNNMPSFMFTLQFPSRRLMPIIALIASFIGGTSLFYILPKSKSKQFNKQLAQFVTILLIFTSFNLLAPTISFYTRERELNRPTLPNFNLPKLDDSKEIPHEQSSSIIEPLSVSSGEYLPTALSVAGKRNPKSSRYYSYTIASSNFLISRGKNPMAENNQVNFEKFHKNGSNMHFEVENPTDRIQKIELPAIFYPGFKAELDGNNLPVGYSKNGLLEIEIPAKASGKIKTRYGLSSLSATGLTLTTLTFIALSYALLSNRKRRS